MFYVNISKYSMNLEFILNSSQSAPSIVQVKHLPCIVKHCFFFTNTNTKLKVPGYLHGFLFLLGTCAFMFYDMPFPLWHTPVLPAPHLHPFPGNLPVVMLNLLPHAHVEPVSPRNRICWDIFHKILWKTCQFFLAVCIRCLFILQKETPFLLIY